MEYLKIRTLSREAILTATLVGSAALAPLLHSQLVTGTIVNATLFVAAMTLGFWTMAGVAVIPSLIAISVGTLPLAMAPLIPAIMASNIVLATIFMLLKKYSYLRAAVLACMAKFLFLVSASSLVFNFFSPGASASILSSVVGWSQLITAVTGALAAYIFVTHSSNSI